MAGENFLVTRENGFLSVVQNRNYKTQDNKLLTEKCVYNITGNVEGLKEGDIIRADSLDFDLKMVKYMKDGKKCSKIVMLIYGWEKA